MRQETPLAPRPSESKFERHHQPHRRRVERLADAAAMAEDQVALQRLGVFRRNLNAGEFAKAGVDAVDGGAAFRRRADQIGGGVDGGLRSGIEGGGEGLAPETLQGGERRRSGGENQGHRAPPTIRRCSGLKPMR